MYRRGERDSLARYYDIEGYGLVLKMLLAFSSND
jgi:hypothetical protein